MGQTIRVTWALTSSKSRMHQMWNPELYFFPGDKQTRIWNHPHQLMTMMVGVIPPSTSTNNITTSNNNTNFSNRMHTFKSEQ